MERNFIAEDFAITLDATPLGAALNDVEFTDLVDEVLAELSRRFDSVTVRQGV